MENENEEKELTFEEVIKKDYKALEDKISDLQKQIIESNQVLVDMKVKNDELNAKNKDLMSIIRYNGAGSQEIANPSEPEKPEVKPLTDEEILAAFVK